MTDSDSKLADLLYPLFSRLPVDTVYLYGSRINGKSDKLSDYDFAIIFSQKLSEQKRFDLRLKLFGDIAERIGVKEDYIDVVDADEVSLLLQFNAICGKIIYNKNEERRIMFETYVMSRYHDEHYYYDRFLQETIGKIKKGVYFDRPISYT